jgi:hypothetical protein
MIPKNKIVKNTQNKTIEQHLRYNNSITTIEAFKKYGITRLASRIHELKSTGMKIHGVMVKVKNRQGEVVSVKRYYYTGKTHG